MDAEKWLIDKIEKASSIKELDSLESLIKKEEQGSPIHTLYGSKHRILRLSLSDPDFLKKNTEEQKSFETFLEVVKNYLADNS